MVFYFTGTGNSLYAAKYLEKNPVSIPQIIHKSNLEFAADRIGVAAPIYGHQMPDLVRNFLRKAVFRTDYFFLILTYGRRHANAVELAQRFCEAQNIRPAYINTLLMADNWLPGFDMEQERKLDKNVDGQLRQIAADVAAKRRWIAPVTEADRAAHQEFLANRGRLSPDAWQHLIRVTNRCVGCGLCQQVCPTSSIQMEGGKAVHFPGACQTCFACVHACPEMVIGLSIPEKNPDARYRNEHITLQEIIAANRQNQGGTVL